MVWDPHSDVDWKKLEKIKPPCFSQKGDGPKELPAEKEKPMQLPAEKEKPMQLPSNDNSKDIEKKPDPCIDKPKVSTRIEPEDKRSYMEKCKERGVCGGPKKKPTVGGEKSATQCDPDCTGPKRGTKLKKNESRTAPSGNASEKCLPAQRQPLDQPCPPGCIPDPGKTSSPLDQSQPADASKPKEQPMNTCKPSGTIAAPSQPSDTLASSQQNVSKADPCPSIDTTKVAPAPSQSIADTNQSTDGGACRRQRRVVWNKAVDEQNTEASQNPGLTGGCKSRCPSTGGVEGSQGSGKAAEQNTTPCPTSDRPGSDSNQVTTARDPSNPCKSDNKPKSDSNNGPAANDPCKSAIKSSSVTITYPSPPGSADSRVIMSPADLNGPCGRKPYQPKEVTMGENHRRKPKILRDDSPTTHSKPRQTARLASRRKREHETDES